MHGRYPSGVVLLALLLVAGVARAADAPGLKVARLAREVGKEEGIRAVKNLQNAYNQYGQFGLWDQMASLFAADGTATYDQETIKGPAQIRAWLKSHEGGGQDGMPPDALNNRISYEQVVNVSADGTTAKGRWHELSIVARPGQDAEWQGGIMENSYVKEGGIWKIASYHYYPMYAGPFEKGWRDVSGDLPIVPYHYDADQAGTPLAHSTGDSGLTGINDTPTQVAARLQALNQRVDALNDEDRIHNLQNIYGYYAERKMWDDVTDLFTTDGVLETPGGIYQDAKGIRRALEKDGPQGLKPGQLHDLLQQDEIVSLSKNGTEAHVRGIELGQLGDRATGQAYWSVSVFDNRFVKDSDVWKIREMRIFPVMKADYYQSWPAGKSVDAWPTADKPLPDSDKQVRAIPAFAYLNPVTRKAAAAPQGMNFIAVHDLTYPAPAAAADPLAGDVDANIQEVTRKLAVSIGYDGVENISSAFGNWIDDKQFDQLGRLFAQKGMRQLPSVGFYVSPARITEAETVRNGAFKAPRTRIGPHGMTQPVIMVAPDAKFAKLRNRLFQLGSAVDGPASVSGGMYPNNQAVFENGVWRMWTVAIDEFYYQSSWPNGWARGPTPVHRPFTSAPADIGIADNPREATFSGGPGKPVEWPDIKPMWFAYTNPVSGRVPQYYWPDCVTCKAHPDTRASANGF